MRGHLRCAHAQQLGTVCTRSHGRRLGWQWLAMASSSMGRVQWALAVLVALLFLTAPASAQLNQAVSGNLEQLKKNAGSQVRVNNLDVETDELRSKTRALLEQLKSLRKYNAGLEKLIKAQEVRMVELTKAIDDVTNIERTIVPLMNRMIDSIGMFVELDVPFLIEQRRGRVQRLRNLMARADVTAAERFRNILEAYSGENEFGYTIEAYQGGLGEGDDIRTVNFLRIGRIALIYQTMNGLETGIWDHEEKRWVVLDSGFNEGVSRGIDIALDQAIPDLLIVPVKGPKRTKVSEAAQ